MRGYLGAQRTLCFIHASNDERRRAEKLWGTDNQRQLPDRGGCYRSPRPRLRASAAARSAVVAAVYLSTIVRVDHPATLMSPCSLPPARSHRVAAVLRRRWRWKFAIPALFARRLS